MSTGSFLIPFRDRFIAEEMFPEPASFPAFMYRGRDGPADMENVLDGFLMDSGLIKV